MLKEPEPQGAVTLKNLDDKASYQLLLNGIYNGIQQYGASVDYWGASQTGYIKWVFSFSDYRQIAFHTISPNNSVITGFWNQMYKSINEANIIIANISKLKNASQSKIDNILGQAYFTRALMYYYLVKYYAKPWGAKPNNSQLGVPIRLKPVTDTGDFKKGKRATVKKVYAQIIKDLKQASELNIANTSPSKATNGAVTALRARIALIQERWEDAAKFAGKVINSGNYQLQADVAAAFRSKSSPETIFAIKNSPNDNPGDGNTSISVIFNINTRPGALTGKDFISDLKKIVTDKQEAALNALGQHAVDTRVTELLATNEKPPLTIDDYTHSNKYESSISLSDNDPVIRLPEMILTKAEALAHLIKDSNYPNAKQKAIDLLNEIRTRAIKVKKKNGSPGKESLIEYTAADFQTKSELVNTILLERSVELAFEGHRRVDLQRYKRDVQGVRWDSYKLVFPIPQSQIDASDMKQTPGY